MPVKIFKNKTTSPSEQVSGINWAVQNGADILSNSWGSRIETLSVTDAINDAVNAGCIVIASSGNDEISSIEYPAASSNVIAVGASTMCDDKRKARSSCDGENSWGSNYGEGLDVVAPGVKIYTTDLTGTLQGYNTNPSDPDNGDYTSSFNGTSSACPNVAGVVALMLSVNPNLNQEEVRKILAETADKPSAYTYSNNEHGAWNQEVGYGRVNANRAVLAALDVHIEGEDKVCNMRPLIYKLKNLPRDSDVNVVWTHSPNLTPSYDPAQGEHDFTVVANGKGKGWVQADINGAIFRKEIAWIGTADVELDRISNSNYVTVNLVGANGTDISDQGISSVVWEVLSNNEGECYASFYANHFTGYGNGNCFNWLVKLKITVTNECGTAIFYENVSPQAIDPCDPNGRISFSENPMKEGASTNKIIIDPCADGRVKGSSEVEQYTVSVHTYYGEQVYSKTQKEINFDISHLKKGFYIARFTTKDGLSSSKQFIIE